MSVRAPAVQAHMRVEDLLSVVADPLPKDPEKEAQPPQPSRNQSAGLAPGACRSS